MIKDKIDNIDRYSLNGYFEDFKKQFKIIKKSRNYKIESPFKAIPLSYSTGDHDLSKFENHQKYIDIHYILKGHEVIGLTDLATLTSNMEYDDENDYQLYKGKIEDKVNLHQGEFLILFPNEAHVTGGINKEVVEQVEKIVFKVPL